MHYLLVRLAAFHRLLLADPANYQELMRAFFLCKVKEIAVGLFDSVTRFEGLHPDAASTARMILLAAPRKRTAAVAAHRRTYQVVHGLMMIQVPVVPAPRLVPLQQVVRREHHVKVLLLFLFVTLVMVTAYNVHHVRLNHDYLVVYLLMVRVRQAVIVLHVNRLRVRGHRPRILGIGLRSL